MKHTFLQSFQIGSRLVGVDAPPLIIAEMSGNHNQSLDRALKIVHAAADSGAHAVKLQTYTADTMTLPVRSEMFSVGAELSLWKGKNLHDLYREAATPWEWHKEIFEACRSRGMFCFSTPFDESSVDFLESLGAPCYKIASFEATHLPLIRKAVRTGKPIIASTGMADLGELHDLVSAVKSEGGNVLSLLKCTSAYPSLPRDANIRTIPHMAELFGCPVGISDHTMGIGVSLAAVALGAVIVERHFTLRRSDGGVDAAFSLEPEEFRMLVTEADAVWHSRGVPSYSPTEGEEKSRRYRRSIFFVEQLKAGTRVEAHHVKIVRPEVGLRPKFIDEVIGKVLTSDVEPGTPATWSILKTQ